MELLSLFVVIAGGYIVAKLWNKLRAKGWSVPKTIMATVGVFVGMMLLVNVINAFADDSATVPSSIVLSQSHRSMSATTTFKFKDGGIGTFSQTMRVDNESSTKEGTFGYIVYPNFIVINIDQYMAWIGETAYDFNTSLDKLYYVDGYVYLDCDYAAQRAYARGVKVTTH